MKPIEGLSVLVTGGGSGISEGIAQFYIERGAKVTICGRRKEKIDAVAAGLGESCMAVQADITSGAILDVDGGLGLGLTRD